MARKAKVEAKAPVGAVLVIGGGVAGIQSALDLADTGFKVFLAEKSPGIGGVMARLDKTFPTNDCAMCILAPKLVECGRHPNIELLPLTEVASVEGSAGDFTVTLVQKPRYVDPKKCIACGACAEKCPKKVPDAFNEGLRDRKAAYIYYDQAVPLKYALDPDNCIYLQKGKCGACEKICPTQAIRFEDTPRTITAKVGAILAAPGFRPFNPAVCDTYGYGTIPDVVTSLEYERMLSSSGPCHGHLTRPSDHAEPPSVAWLQCVGSRTTAGKGSPACSNVCCMYALKQAVMTLEHTTDKPDLSIFYMDLRTHGKGFEESGEAARAKGVQLIRCRPHTFLPGPDGKGVDIRWADENGREQRRVFGLAVLSVGLNPPPDASDLAAKLGLALDERGFARTSGFDPTASTKPGVFVSGCFHSAMDIPTSVVMASAAASGAARLLAPARGSLVEVKPAPVLRDVSRETPRVGVFVCSCGSNIAGVIDVKGVAEYAATLPYVAHVDNNLFTCSQDAQGRMAQAIRDHGLNRVVVAACTPRTHEPLFRETMVAAGLNKYLFDMANIRNQASWVHANEPEAATAKARDLVRMAVARVARLKPLSEKTLPVNNAALVVGGGVAGMGAALDLAGQGFPVTLVEREDSLGGVARDLRSTSRGERIADFLSELALKVRSHKRITVLTEATLTHVEGFVGKFVSTVRQGRKSLKIEHGAAVLATGAVQTRPREYCYGRHPGVMTHLEMDRALTEGLDPRTVGEAVFIQCVGSREPQRPWCSRVCCTHAVKLALHLKEKNPACRVAVLYRDMRTYGERELLYQKARKLGVLFIRYELSAKPRVSVKDGGLKVLVRDHVLDMDLEFRPDILALAAAIAPPDTDKLSRLFKVSTDTHGWFQEAHVKLRPVDFATDGVFLAGMAHGPKALDESLAQAQAAAARAAQVLSRTEMTLSGITALVDEAKCVGCRMCVTVCPFRAISLNAKNLAEVNEAMCKGCGLCTGSCRSSAIALRGFTDQDLMAQIGAMFAD